MNTMNTSRHGATSMGITSNSKHYEIDASTILSTANQFKNMTDFAHETIKFHTLFQQFSLDIGRFDVKIKVIHTIRLFTFLLFHLLASFGSILIDTSKLETIVSNIFKIFTYAEVFVPEETTYYIVLIINFSLLILCFSLFFFCMYISMRYRHNLCISIGETYIFVIMTRIVAPLFTPYVAHFFTFSLYRLIFMENSSESAILFVISIPIIVAHISFIFFSCSAYNATPVIRKHDTMQIWFSHSSYDWGFSINVMVLIFIQTFFKFLSEDVSSVLFALVSITVSVCSAVFIIIKLPFIYPRTNALFFGMFVSSAFCSICPILANYAHKALPFYLVFLLLFIIASLFVGKYVINYKMIKTLKRFDQANFQTTIRNFSPNNDGLLNSFLQKNNDSPSNYDSMMIKSDHDLSLLTRVGFLFNVPDINNSNFVHYGLEMTSKADFVLSAIQVMLAIQTDNIILTPLYQTSLTIGNAPFNFDTFRTLFNLMRQEMLTQFNKPLIEAITVVKRSNHFLELTISDFWTDVVKQKVDTLVHLLPRITEEKLKTELLFLRLARNYPLSPAVYREVVIFYYKVVGDYHQALHFQGLIDKAKAYQYNRPTYNHQNNLSLYSSFSSSSSSNSNHSMEFLDNVNSEMNNLHEKLEPFIMAQDSVMSVPLPPLGWMYATMVITIIVLLALPAVILGISLYDVKKFRTSFTPIETIGDLDLVVARIPQLLRRRNLMEIDKVISPPPIEAGEPMSTHLELISKESVEKSIYFYHDKLVEDIDQLLKLCVPGSSLTKTCSEKIYESRVGDSIVYASVFDLLSSFETLVGNILSDANFDWKTASSSSSINIIMQNFDILYSSLNTLINVLKNEINDFSKLTKIWLLLIWIVPFVIILPLVFISCYLLKKEVIFTLKLLFQIPKNEILDLKMSFKKKKHEHQRTNLQTSNHHQMLMPNPSDNLQSYDDDQNSVENNDDLADSLATVPKKISGLTGNFMLRLLILVLFTCVMVTIGIVVFHESNFQLIDMSNAYASSINVYSSTFASYIWTQELFAENPLLFTRSELKKKSYAYVVDFISQFNNLLYGNSSHDHKDVKSGLLLGTDVIETFLQSDSLVFDENEKLLDPVYGVIHMVYITMSCESQMRLFTLNSQWLFDDNSQVSFDYSDMFVYHYEHILFSHLNAYLYNAVNLFEEKTTKLNESKTDQLIMIFTIMFLVDILYYSTFLVSSFRVLLNHLKITRHLLLLVPPEALLKSQSIVKWMTGTLDSSKHARSAELKKKMGNEINTDFVIQYSKCGFALSSTDLKIDKINDTFCQMFHKKEEEVIGMNFITFLKRNLIDKDQKIFSWVNSEIHKMLEGTSTNYKCHFKSSVLRHDAKLLHVQVVIEGIQDFGIETTDASSPAKSFSIVVMDQTSKHQLELQIHSEKEKVTSLYNHHFYDQIHRKLNANTSDVSFEVHEATVMFTSIRNWNDLFTTSTNPTEIVAFLSKLYTSYDNELKSFPSLMKIKTIGPTYIMCGDLFSDESFNDAYIVINFSLKVLSVAKQLCESSNINAEITIGINTGGPIICGLLGRLNPLFDIAGDAVNIASKMNSFGLPGLIQMTESTYNSVRYLNYNMKEREKVQISDFDVRKTYLVSDVPFTAANQNVQKNDTHEFPKDQSHLDDCQVKPTD